MAPTFRLSVAEPHPSIPAKQSHARLSSGRGGAGNYRSYSSASLTPGSTATGPASRFSISSASTASSSSSSSSAMKPVTGPSPSADPSARPVAASTAKPRRNFLSGIGGMGNARPDSERRIFSFDEELERQAMLTDNFLSTPVYRVGRGGAGNTFADKSGRSGSGGSAASVSSAGSVASDEGKRRMGMKEKLARALKGE